MASGRVEYRRAKCSATRRLNVRRFQTELLRHAKNMLAHSRRLPSPIVIPDGVIKILLVVNRVTAAGHRMAVLHGLLALLRREILRMLDRIRQASEALN